MWAPAQGVDRIGKEEPWARLTAFEMTRPQCARSRQRTATGVRGTTYCCIQTLSMGSQRHLRVITMHGVAVVVVCVCVGGGGVQVALPRPPDRLTAPLVDHPTPDPQVDVRGAHRLAGRVDYRANGR